MEADNLHHATALFSNSLHQFADADIQGAKEVVEKIIQKRNEWKAIKAKIEYFEKTGKLPETSPKAAPGIAISSAAVSELKLEVARLNSLVSKAKKKLEINPNHKKAEQWREDMAKMEALKNEIRTKIVELTYATT